MNKPRVLFVDDDADVLRGLGRALRKHRDRWDMEFAIGGPAGVAEIQRATCDVVVTDMRMPEIDGAALLGHVRDHDPTTFRVVLSGFSDRSAVTRVLPLAHQFFDKPCDLKVLAATIDRACRLRAMFVAAGMRELTDQIAKLPPPRVYHELAAMIDRLAIPAATLAPAIERDPAVAARFRAMAGTDPDNAPTSVVAAISQIGVASTAGLALAAHAFEALGVSVAAQQHALQIGRAAARAMPDPTSAAEAFTTGLLHDLGQASAGGSHALFGAYLLAQWCVPLAIVEAVAFHASPGTDSNALADVVRAAHA